MFQTQASSKLLYRLDLEILLVIWTFVAFIMRNLTPYIS
jgi:hypothetical protein